MLTHHHIRVRQGEMYVVRAYMPQSDGWRSLTGASTLCQIRTSAQAPAPVAAINAAVQVENDLVILVLTPAENNKLSPETEYEWDLRLAWDDGEVTYPIGGSVKTTPAVSRA